MEEMLLKSIEAAVSEEFLALFTGNVMVHINTQFQWLNVMKNVWMNKWCCSGGTNGVDVVLISKTVSAYLQT